MGIRPRVRSTNRDTDTRTDSNAQRREGSTGNAVVDERGLQKGRTTLTVAGIVAGRPCSPGEEAEGAPPLGEAWSGKESHSRLPSSFRLGGHGEQRPRGQRTRVVLFLPTRPPGRSGRDYDSLRAAQERQDSGADEPPSCGGARSGSCFPTARNARGSTPLT
jgi:hypothetical protein